MPYGQSGRLGESINPALGRMDFSGFAQAGAIKGQAIGQMGYDIGNIVKQRSEQKKRDAQNEKFLKQAFDMVKGTALEGPVGAAYQDYISDETSDKQRRAIGESIRETLSLGMAAQDMRMRQAAMMARGEAKPPKIEDIPDGRGGTYKGVWDASVGQYRPLSEYVGGFGQSAPQPSPQAQGEAINGMYMFRGPSTPTQADAQQIANAASMYTPSGAGDYDPSMVGSIPLPPSLPEGGGMDGGFGVLPSKDGRYGEVIGAPPSFAPPVASDQQQAGKIMQAIMMGGEAQPQPQQIQAAISGGIGYTPPEEKGEWSEPYELNGRMVVKKLSGEGKGDIKDFLKGDPMQINLGDKASEMRDAAQIEINTENYKKYAASADKIPNLERLKQLVEQGVKTGSFADLRVSVGKLLGKDVADLEEFQQIAGNAAMDMVQLTKGSVSDAEMNFFTNILTPSINKSLESNRRAIEFALDSARRAKEQKQIILRMRKDGASPYAIEEALDAHREANKVDWVKRFGLSGPQYQTEPGTNNILPGQQTQDLIQRSYGQFGR